MPNHPTLDGVNFMDGFWFQHEPHDAWTWMRENAPVYYDANSDVWGISRYHDILAIEKDPKTFSSYRSPRPHGNSLPMMISMDDPEHKQRRKLVNRGFTPKRVRDRTPEVIAICDEILDKVCERGECDFIWDIAAPLPLILIGDMLGFPRESYDDLLEWSDDMMRATTETDQEAMEKGIMAGVAFREFLMGVIADRRARPPQSDLVSVLCHAEVDGDRLDDESLYQEGLLILIGGDETSRHVISGGMLALMEHPDQKSLFNQRAADDAWMERAVEELLRWVTPIKNMSRSATRDVEMHGETIGQDDQVILFYPSANRDDRVFDNPFKFDLEREPNQHLAFGWGTHFCLGASLARLELKIMFQRLAERMPDMQLATDDPLPWRASNFIVGPEEMPVTFTPSAPVGV